MKKYLLFFSTLLLSLALAHPALAKKRKQPFEDLNEAQKRARLIYDLKQLDPAIVDVTPSRIRNEDEKFFKIQWMPALTLKKGTSREKQHEIAAKLTQYIVAFQGGVPTKNRDAGTIGFFDGENDWTPEVKNVIYRLTPINRKRSEIDVWTQIAFRDRYGRLSCCQPGARIGRIEGTQFKY